jgi:hypothetical protein
LDYSLISLISSIILTIITGFYAYQTYILVNLTQIQSKIINQELKLQSNPVLGIHIEKIFFHPRCGPEKYEMGIKLKISNISDSPALQIIIDSEIELKILDSEDIKYPQLFPPETISFLKPNSSDTNYKTISLIYRDFIPKQLLIMYKKNLELFQERKQKGKLCVYNQPLIHIYIYYQNNLGQFYRVHYSQYFTSMFFNDFIDFAETDSEKLINRQSYEFTIMNIPRSNYSIELIDSKLMDDEIYKRNELENLRKMEIIFTDGKRIHNSIKRKDEIPPHIDEK